jgi:uracil-DNA glycosylase
LEKLLKEIRACNFCEADLELGANPVMRASDKSKIILIGQAPGTIVHKTSIPWNDPSGVRLRKWMNVSDVQFYDEDLFAIVPMGFCYPGKGKSGDLPPDSRCAPKWHPLLMERMPQIELILLIGMYAQNYYLGDKAKRTLTETVKNFQTYLPRFLPMPHPSPRNRLWLNRNPWFEESIVPILQSRVKELIE